MPAFRPRNPPVAKRLWRIRKRFWAAVACLIGLLLIAISGIDPVFAAVAFVYDVYGYEQARLWASVIGHSSYLALYYGWTFTFGHLAMVVFACWIQPVRVHTRWLLLLIALAVLAPSLTLMLVTLNVLSTGGSVHWGTPALFAWAIDAVVAVCIWRLSNRWWLGILYVLEYPIEYLGLVLAQLGILYWEAPELPGWKFSVLRGPYFHYGYFGLITLVWTAMAIRDAMKWKGHCPACGYDLAGLTTCPECGEAEITPPGAATPPQAPPAQR